MGRSHVASGWCSGVLAGSALPLPPAAVIGFGCVGAGAAALNDLDHDDSSATRALGRLSHLLADLVQAYARWVYRRTRGPGDPRHRGAHRGATHALPLLPLPCTVLAGLPWAASVIGAAVAALAGWDGELVSRWAGAGVVAAVIGFCLLVAADRLGSRFLVAAGMAAGVACSWQFGIEDPVQTLVLMAPWVALAVLVGTVTHVLGDLVTEHGLCALAPLYRVNAGTSQERRWVRVALPKWLAFKTGQWFEHRVVFPLLVVAAVLVTPGVWPLVVSAAAAVINIGWLG
ncbi:MAG TPA: metal-dependent hydrolase [Pseudonocardiaceae bacterium]|nr:metal-dependent hydrolase [Pseudonocardiaceae bacterium]